MDKSKYLIDVLPLFKNSQNNILSSDIKVLEPLIDYTKENRDEKRDMDYYYSILANPLKFNKLLKDRYDCVIACNHNAPSYFASYMTNTPKVVWIRGDMSELNYNNFNPATVEYSGTKQEYNMQKNVLNTFDNIVVISEVVKKALENNFGITENIYEIPNSVDVEKIKELSNEKIKLPRGHLFTTLGRLDNNKNQILLLKAAKLVKKYREDFKIYLLGDGEDRKKLEDYIKENDLEENVQILGFKENPYPYIKNSVATVLTSFSEGFSLALAESVILDTPIISTDVGIAKELTQKYDCGTLIGYDERELADILLKYMEQNDNDKEKRHFGIEDEFDIQTELEKTIQVIDDTMDKAEGKTKMKKLPYPVEKIDYYDLENSSLILKTIIQKMNIELEDTVIYGTSAGGFLSIIMGIYLKGAKVVADNTQLDVSNWAFISAVDYVMEYCFDNIGTALKYPERFNVVEAFIKHNYVPKIYLHVNLCSKVDNSMQLSPFLERIETMKNVTEYNNIEIILHYEEKKGHDGLSQDEAIKFLYEVLDK